MLLKWIILMSFFNDTREINFKEKNYQRCEDMKLQKLRLIHFVIISYDKTVLRTDCLFQVHWKQRWLFRIVSIRSILYMLHLAFCCRTLSPMTHVKVSCRDVYFDFLCLRTFFHFFSNLVGTTILNIFS